MQLTCPLSVCMSLSAFPLASPAPQNVCTALKKIEKQLSWGFVCRINFLHMQKFRDVSGIGTGALPHLGDVGSKNTLDELLRLSLEILFRLSLFSGCECDTTTLTGGT